MKIATIEYYYYKESIKVKPLLSEEFEKIVSQRVIISNHDFNCSETGNAVVLNHTNQGKDIGAKLIGIDYLISTKQEVDIVFFFHDKRSPHSPLGNLWFNELTKVFRQPHLSIVLEELTKSKVGICCTANYIKSEYNRHSGSFDTSNDLIIKQLISKYNIVLHNSFQFVAGTIFCCKWEPVKSFFLRNDPLKIKSTLEMGNVQDTDGGTITHSWERLFSWIITTQGYSIKGL